MDKDEVRVCLRALLSSSVFSYTLNSLLSDFRTITGLDLPLFGCVSPVEFLRTLSDTVQLIGDSLNPQVALVESKKSAHITSLVDRQKTNTKNSSFTRHQGGWFRQKRLIIPDKSETCNGTKEDDDNLFSNSSPQKTKAPSQSSIFWFGNSFQNRPKEDPTPATCLNTESEKLSNSTPSQDSLGNETKEQPKKPVEPPQEKTDNCYFEDISDNEDCLEGMQDSGNSLVVNEGIKNKFRKLIKNYPDGLWCCDLPELFLKEYKFELDYREFGYTSLIQMLYELTDVFRCVRPGKGDWILFDASIQPGPVEKKMKDLELGTEINCEIKRNIQKLLFNCFENKHPIELNKILDLYKEMFGSALDFHSLGFKDLESLLETWEGSFLNILKVDGKTFVVPGLKRSPNSRIRREEAVPPITAENDLFAEIFPKDVVGPNEGPSELDLMRQVAVGNVVEVCIAEVWSPKRFYVQLNKFKKPFQKFMEELQNFYNAYLKKYKMPDSTIRPKQLCVGLYNPDPESPEEWYRAEIIKVINEKTVLVYFLDYGTVTRLKKTHLRFLHRSFHSFPVQAFLARLSGVVPPDNTPRWSLSTSKKFLELTRVPHLKAEITDIDFKIPLLNVTLFDPLQKTAISINQQLVLEKLACLKEDAPEPSENQNEAVSDEPSDETAQEDKTEDSPEQKEAFSDIADLDQTTLFHFKMKSLSLTDSALPEKKSSADKTVTDEKVSFEFEEVPDLILEKDWKQEGEKVTEKEPIKEIPKSEPEENSTASVGASPLQQKARNARSQGVRKYKNPPPSRFQQKVRATQTPSAFSVKPNQLPPGFEQANILPSFSQVQFYLQPEEFNRRVNILAMELLTTKPSIKLVAVNNPALALEIAREMAEVYVASQFPGGVVAHGVNALLTAPFPNVLGPPLQFQQNVYDAKQPALPDFSVSRLKPTDKTTDFIGLQQPQTAPAEEKEPNEHVKVRQVADKTLRVVTIEDRQYCCAEEIVRNFSAIPNRETADRILHARFQPNYRIVTKSSDEELLKAIKCTNPTFYTGKLKKLKIYLIPLEEVVPFLQALNCKTEAFEDFDLKCGGKKDTDAGKEVS